MKYMGSKNRIAKHILPIMLKDRAEGQYWVEPFVGGANMIDKVDGNRIGSDSNKYLIALLRRLQSNHELPVFVTKSEYTKVKDNKSEFDDWYVGYIGFLFSFGAKFFGGFVGEFNGVRDRVGESYRDAMKTRGGIARIKFECCSYDDLNIPPNSIIYCDPPYEGTTRYKDKFNHADFWRWCRGKSKEGHTVFVSEYNAPDDFKCIWQQELNVSVAKSGKHKKAIEKLFTI